MRDPSADTNLTRDTQRHDAKQGFCCFFQSECNKHRCCDIAPEFFDCALPRYFCSARWDRYVAIDHGVRVHTDCFEVICCAARVYKQDRLKIEHISEYLINQSSDL